MVGKKKKSGRGEGKEAFKDNQTQILLSDGSTIPKISCENSTKYTLNMWIFVYKLYLKFKKMNWEYKNFKFFFLILLGKRMTISYNIYQF